MYQHSTFYTLFRASSHRARVVFTIHSLRPSRAVPPRRAATPHIMTRELPLAALFARADRADASVETCEAFRDAVRATGGLGRAETLDDLDRIGLKLALGHRLAGRAHARCGRDGVERAIDALEAFVSLVRELDGVPREEIAACEGEEEGTSRRARGGDGRADKVRRFKAKRRCEKRMEEIEEILKRRSRVEEESGSESASEEDETDHDALEREYWMKRIELETYETLDELPSLRMEREMFLRRDELEEARRAERERMDADERVGRDARIETYTIEREDVNALAGPSILTADPRTRFRTEVFRPTVALPTMTVEQFGEIERREMLERELRSAERELERAAIRAAKTEEQIEEEELAETRRWDAFKDDNPYGSGNSRLRPCS